jgi:hypothetical protein
MATAPSDEARHRCERTSARGFVGLHRVGPQQLSLVLRGNLTDGDGDFIAEWLEQMLPTCEQAIVDFTLDELEAYTSAVRKNTQRALLHHEERWTRVFTLVRSRVVVMGVAVANVALGGRIEAFTERAAFERAIAGALSRAQR